MGRVKPPCYGCTDRTVSPNCHCTCERFKAYKDELIAQKTQENLARHNESQMRDYAIDSQQRIKKLKREKR